MSRDRMYIYLERVISGYGRNVVISESGRAGAPVDVWAPATLLGPGHGPQAGAGAPSAV